MTDDVRTKLEELKDIILEGAIPDDRIAGIAGVDVADVAAYRAEIGAGAAVPPAGTEAKKPPPKQKGPIKVTDPPLTARSEATPPAPAAAPDMIDAGVLELARAAQDLIDTHGFRLRNGRLRPPRGEGAGSTIGELAAAIVPFAIRLIQRFATKHVVNGRQVDAVFQPSVYRGDMARMVKEYAEKEKLSHLVEVIGE